MNLIKSMMIAISMYSKIPTPFVEWNDKAMRYIFCFFPIIGIFLGTAQIGWYYLANYLCVGRFFYAAVATVLPLLITGGIHMDGYLDTMDARHSYQSKEKRLEIMKDPHIGAFSVIMALVYMVLYFGAMTEVTSLKICIMMSITYVVSRAFSSIAFSFFVAAKKEGLFYQFQSVANKKAIIWVESIVLLVCTGALITMDEIVGIVLMIVAVLVFVYYKRLAAKEFGGVTGDVAGYFLQLCEGIMLVVLVLVA